MRGVQPLNQGHGMLDMFEGPCCEVEGCPVRKLWPQKGESKETFIARLRHEHRGAVGKREMHS